MKKYIFSLIVLLIGFTGFSQIEGKWKTIDDETGKEKAIIEITQKDNGKYYGKIVELLIEPANDKCVKCKGDLKNQPLEGLEILRGLKKNGESWEKGKITDPENGKTYKAKAEINDNGDLDVRGYVGISLMGRTQTWKKTD